MGSMLLWNYVKHALELRTLQFNSIRLTHRLVKYILYFIRISQSVSKKI